MHVEDKQAISELFPVLTSQIKVDEVSKYLRLKDVIGANAYEKIENETNNQEKATKILECVQLRDNGWLELCQALDDSRQTYLRKKLEDKRDGIRQHGHLWNVSPRNHDFTGRDSLFNELISSFLPYQQLNQPPPSKSHKRSIQSNITVTAVCYGPGGVGKTQLAIQFVHRYQQNYSHVFWFPAEDSIHINITYQKLAQKLKIDARQPINAIITEIKAWFNQHPGCLLIYDNAPDYDIIKNYLPEIGNHILITSRSTHWPSERIAKTIDVNVFTAEEAKKYLQNIFGDQLDMDEADKLVKRLDYLPLALAQAADYIKNNQMTFTDYLTLYETCKQKLLAVNDWPDNKLPVIVTWDITINAIQQKSGAAADLLKMCAYYHPDDIPEFLLQEFMDEKNSKHEPEYFKETLNILADYSMIRPNTKTATFSMHRLLQEVLQLHLKQQNNNTFLIQARTTILKSFPDDDQQNDYEKVKILIPHLETVLHHLDEASSDKIMNDEQSKNDLLFKLAKAYEIMGDYRKECESLERALAIHEKLHGPNHNEVAVTLASIGKTYGNLGDYTKQRELLERALAIEENYFGPNHISVAATLANLGNAYGHLGDYAKQRDLLERALIITEKHYGPSHQEVATTLNNLSNAYENLGNYEKQRELLERALVLDEHHYGPNHKEIAVTVANLGNVYGYLGDYKKQCELLERALKIIEIQYGPNHKEVATTLNNLSNAYENLGDYKKQRELLERALAICEKNYGPNHIEFAVTLANLGNVYGYLGDYEKQRELLERALVIKENYYGLNHKEVATTLNNLSNAYGNLGDYVKQRELLERALVIKEKHYGSNHIYFAVTLANLGKAYGNLGDFAKQCELLERALILYEKHYGSNHIEFAVTLVSCARAHEALGNHKTKLEYMQRALPIYQMHYGRSANSRLTRLLNDISDVYLNMPNVKL